MKSEWDKLVDDYSKKIISPFYSLSSRNELLKLIPENANPLRTLDLGCGKGFLTKLLKDTCIGDNEFSCTDISFEMIKSTKNNLMDKTLFSQSSADKLPFRENYFTLIATINSIIMADPNVRKKSFKEISRVLSSGGHLIALFPSNENHYEQLYYLKKQFENSGAKENDAINKVYEDLNERLFDPIGGYVNIANEDIRIKLYSEFEIMDIFTELEFENISIKKYFYPDELVNDLGLIVGQNGLYDWFVSASRI